LEKIRKTLNAANVNHAQLFDPEEATEEQIREMEQLKNAND